MLAVTKFNSNSSFQFSGEVIQKYPGKTLANVLNMSFK